jgi:hypothetical protein
MRRANAPLGKAAGGGGERLGFGGKLAASSIDRLAYKWLVLWKYALSSLDLAALVLT